MLFTLLIAGMGGLLIASLTPDKYKIAPERADRPEPERADRQENEKVPSFTGATGWINSKLLTRADLQGKVVVVEFWTYTCINWRRTLPFVKAWAEKYKDHGLVVIGVHTPEFSFERDADNIRQAVKTLSIDFPVAIDNHSAIWFAFRNEYWPALYFVDAQGRIRHHQFGEGDYGKSELVIQQLLEEAGAKGVNHDLVPVVGTGAEQAADWADLGSPETYLGYQKTENFSSPEGMAADRRSHYSSPGTLLLNDWALAGDWTMGAEAGTLNSGGGRLVYRFHARDVNLVMGPSIPGKCLRFVVRIDGKEPGVSHGVDVDSLGNGVATEQRLYQLIRQPGSIADRLIEIEFPDSGIEVFDFTFG